MIYSNVEPDIFLLGTFRRLEALLVRMLREKRVFLRSLFREKFRGSLKSQREQYLASLCRSLGRRPGAPPGEAEVG